MKALNTLISHYGADRFLHFFVAALIVAQTEFCYTEYPLAPVYALGFVAVIAFLKELLLDDQFDFKDFWFSIIGALVELVLLIARSNFFYIPW